MGCKSCCSEPSQLVIERVVKAIVNQLIIDGKLQAGLTDCSGIALAAGQKVMVCGSNNGNTGNPGGNNNSGGNNTVDIHLSNAELNGNTLVLTLTNGKVFNVDLSSIAGQGGGGQPAEDNFVTGVAVSGSLLTIDMKGGAVHTVDLQPLVKEALDKTIADVVYQSGTGLVISVRDGTKFTAAVPAVRGVEFDSGTRLLTISLDDGSSVMATIPAGSGTSPGTDNDTVVSRFYRTGNELTIEMTDGRRHEVDLTPIVDDVQQKQITSIGSERTLVPTRRNDADGAAVSVYANELILTTSDGTQFTTKLPDFQTQIVGSATGIGISVPGSTADQGANVNGYNLDASATLLGKYHYDTSVNELAASLPLFFAVPTVANGKLRLTTKMYTGGHGASMDTPSAQAKTTDLFTREIDLPGGGSLTASASVPAITSGSTYPLDVVGTREQLLGKPYKWAEMQLDGETVLVPVWKKP